MTGDDNFTRIHIEAALEQCSVFVVFNTTFQETEPDITYTIETFCQNNCSGHGICNAGKSFHSFGCLRKNILITYELKKIILKIKLLRVFADT